MIKTKKNKKKENAIIWVTLAFTVIVILLIFVYWHGEGGIKENLKLKKQIETLDRGIEKLKIENFKIEQEIIKMKKDPNYLIEKVGREELHFKKADEQIIYFKEGKDDNKNNKR
jgi:cell division protein FtsB